MALHAQAQALLARLDALRDPPLEESTPAEARARREAWATPSQVELPDVRDLDCGGVPCRLYRPREGELGLCLYLHGGGWVVGSLDTHDDVARRLSTASGHAVLSVGYRLAPEHPFPAALEDVLAAARWASENASVLGCDPARLAIAGDSAGGNLAAVATQRSEVPFRLQVLVYPVTDARCVTASYRELGDGPLLTASAMAWYIGHYLSGEDGSPEDPRVSPLLAEDALLVNSPPTLVVTASEDVLRDEGEAYAQRLSSLGVPCTLRRYEGVFHGFVAFAGLLEDGARALEECGAAIAKALDPSGP
ncbi:MAG: alpha/beta hydrolase [Thermoleophilia bacterium]|nr:alpha/beta hydrolase [Gaiellaceae bacterium]MDW8337863.1 alpha/beta hydrolase [Thermoleophilia bacterium]